MSIVMSKAIALLLIGTCSPFIWFIIDLAQSIGK